MQWNFQGQYMKMNINQQPQMVNPQINQPQKTLEIQITQLQQQFPNKVLVKNDATLNGEKQIMIQLEIKINEKLLEFPEEAPRIFGKRKIISHIVNQETNELIYLNLVAWNANQSLSNVLVQIDRYFNQLYEDYLKNQNQNSIQNAIARFQQLNCKSLLGNLNQQQLAQVENYSTFQEEIVKSDEYRNLLKTLTDHYDILNKMVCEIDQKSTNYQNLMDDLRNLSQVFENKKEILINKYNQCNMIKQRFEKTKVLTILENEINELDEQSQENVQDFGNFNDLFQKNQFNSGVNSDQSFQQKLQKYYANRKKLYTLMSKKEKLEEIL